MPRHAGRHAIGGAIEMAGAARQRVEHRGAIDQVLARQDQRRMRGPEQDAAAPEIGAPGGIGDLLAMRIQPALA
jgi:hypothetical protein